MLESSWQSGDSKLLLLLFTKKMLNVVFFEFFYTTTVFSLYGEYVARFPLPDSIFPPCDNGLGFLHQFYVRIQSINQS